MHIDRELEPEDAKHSFQKHPIVEDLLTVNDIVVAKTV